MNGKSTKKSTKTSINGVRVPTFSEVTIYSAAHAFSGRVMGISNGHLHLSSDYADYYINLDNIVTVRVTRK
jgi:vacuolar-type H+-ATPase subunit D/Vma8